MASVDTDTTRPDSSSGEATDSAYQRRKTMLSAAANGGELAIVMDPVETQAWFVHHSSSLLDLDDAGRVRELLELADRASKVTARLAREAGDEVAPPREQQESDGHE
jgi:hypothetical protein